MYITCLKRGAIDFSFVNKRFKDRVRKELERLGWAIWRTREVFMDVLQQIEHFFMNVLPSASPIIIAWLSYKLPKKAKEETEKIVSELTG